MELQGIVSEQERLRDAAIFMRGYTSALGDRGGNEISPSQLRRTEQLIKLIVAICAEIKIGYRSLVKRIQKKDEEPRRNALVKATMAIDGLKAVLNDMPKTVRMYPEIGEYWNQDARRTVEDTLELFEEAQETLALGLSSSFKSEIDDARKEAGLETNGKPYLPAR